MPRYFYEHDYQKNEYCILDRRRGRVEPIARTKLCDVAERIVEALNRAD